MKTGRWIALLVLTAALCISAALGVRAGAGAQDSAPPDIERGRHIATALAGCADCHGPTFGGGRPFTRGATTVYSSNLTSGTGGIGGLSDADVRRAIREGVRPDGTRLRVMPSSEYAVMTDADVGDLIAFLRSVPPVDRVVPQSAAPVSSSPPDARPMSVSAAAPPLTGGAYLARIGGCTGCHGAALAGGEQFGAVVAPNISHDGIGAWSFADFSTAMRTGKTPDGRLLSPLMPWQTVGNMTDDELRAVYDFLESQPVHGTN